MENQIGIAVRTAFISHRIAKYLLDISEQYSDSISPYLSALLQDDPLTAVVKSYCQCLGTTSYEKANLFALKRLLAECGMQMSISIDSVHAICPDVQEITLTEDLESNLAAFAQACDDPYSRISEGIERLFSGLHRLIEIRILEKAKEIVRHHSVALARKRHHLVIYDDYGVPDRGKWNNELKHFVTNVIGASLTREDLANLSVEAILAYIEEMATATKPLPEDDSPSGKGQDMLLPRDFELFCSTALQRQGWNTRLTAATGDQGVDIIADRNGLKLIFQCKQYGSPVGNKAVQEAHAGKDFLKADLAIVVSNASFTASAKELAASLNVLLLHHTQLDELDKVLFLNAHREKL